MYTRMRRHSWLKHVGLGACLLLISAWILNAQRTVSFCGGRWVVMLEQGQLCWLHSRNEVGAVGWHTGRGSRTVWLPIWGYRSPGWPIAGIPLWMLLVIAGTCTALFYWPDRRRANACGVCQYDLTANESGRCPECGTPIATQIEEQEAA